MCKSFQPSTTSNPTKSQKSTTLSTPEPKMITKKDQDESTKLFEETLTFNDTTPNPNDGEVMLMKKELKVIVNKTEPSDIFVTPLLTTTDKSLSMAPITEDLPEAEEEEKTTQAATLTGSSAQTTTTVSNSTTENSTQTINASSSTVSAAIHGGVKDCFEQIDGYMMSSTAGGLERGMTMRECQCLCANSK